MSEENLPPTHLFEALERGDEDSIRRLIRQKLNDPHSKGEILPQSIEYLLNLLEEKDEKINQLKEETTK